MAAVSVRSNVSCTPPHWRHWHEQMFGRPLHVHVHEIARLFLSNLTQGPFPAISPRFFVSLKLARQVLGAVASCRRTRRPPLCRHRCAPSSACSH